MTIKPRNSKSSIFFLGRRRSMISSVKLIDLPRGPRPSSSASHVHATLFFVRGARTGVFRPFRSARPDLFFLDLAGAEIGLSPGKV